MSKFEKVGDITVYRIDVPRLFSSGDIQTLRQELSARTAEESGGRFALDFSQVQFLSSRGLGVLVAFHKEAVAKGGRVALFALSAPLKEVLRATRLDSVLLVADSLDDVAQLLRSEK